MSLFRRKNHAPELPIPSPEEQINALETPQVPLTVLIGFLALREDAISQRKVALDNLVRHEGLDNPDVQAALCAFAGSRGEVQVLRKFIGGLTADHLDTQSAA